MEIPLSIIDRIEKENNRTKFHQTFEYEGITYHYFINNSILISQMYRIYSLLAKKLGVASVEYDYIETKQGYLLYVPSICKNGELLYEIDSLPEHEGIYSYYDYLMSWLSILPTMKFNNMDSALKEFYKQCFFGLMIFDDDHQISVVKDNQGLCRIGEYFDYGGVYMLQDGRSIDINVFYDDIAYAEFCAEYDGEEEYTKEKLQKDLDLCIKQSITDEIYWHEELDYFLTRIIPFIDSDFIDRCFSVDIMDIINSDSKHNYSDNFKKVIVTMFETSRSLLKNKLSAIINDQPDCEEIKER